MHINYIEIAKYGKEFFMGKVNNTLRMLAILRSRRKVQKTAHQKPAAARAETAAARSGKQIEISHEGKVLFSILSLILYSEDSILHRLAPHP